MTPRSLKKTITVLTSPGRPLARQPAVPEVEAECGGEEGEEGDQDGEDGEDGEDAPWHGAATGDAALLPPHGAPDTKLVTAHCAQG